jgi:hypothetical protein
LLVRSVLEVVEIMAIIRAGVGRLEEIAAGAAASELDPAGYHDEWTIAAVLAHLRACNDVLGGAMLRIIREDHPAWTAQSPRTWQAKSGYHQVAFELNLEAFRTGRADLLVALEPLPVDEWERTATVKVPPGKLSERSTHYYGDWLAQHERTHLEDLERRRAPLGRT